jgi:ribosomal protein S18 acetylase RimI-like enzyme
MSGSAEGIEMRVAGDADAPAVRELILSLAGSMGEESTLTEDYVRHYLATPGNLVLLAVDRASGRPAGLISCSVRPNLYHAGDSALIEELVVAEGARARGIGGALLAKLLKRLEAAGCVEVSVTTLSDNDGAIRFYKRHGLVDEAVFLEKHF